MVKILHWKIKLRDTVTVYTSLKFSAKRLKIKKREDKFHDMFEIIQN